LKPTPGETLYLYLAVLELAVSRALVREEEGVQKLVYYVNHAMNNPQTRYQRMEKPVFVLFIISRKLKHYFQTFQITVLSKHPLRIIVENPEATRRISKWALELRSYRLKYGLRTSIKGQKNQLDNMGYQKNQDNALQDLALRPEPGRRSRHS